MQLDQALAEVQEVRNRVLLSKRGEADPPTEEEIRGALSQLRGARRTAAESNKKSKTTAKKIDVDSLFAAMPGAKPSADS